MSGASGGFIRRKSPRVRVRLGCTLGLYGVPHAESNRNSLSRGFGFPREAIPRRLSPLWRMRAAVNHFLLAPELLADALRWPKTIRSTWLLSIFVSLPFTSRLTLTSVTEMRSPCITVPLRKTNVSTVDAVNSSVPSGASLKLDSQDSGITPQVLPIFLIPHLSISSLAPLRAHALPLAKSLGGRFRASFCLRFDANLADGRGTRQGCPPARFARPVTEPSPVC